AAPRAQPLRRARRARRGLLRELRRPPPPGRPRLRAPLGALPLPPRLEILPGARLRRALRRIDRGTAREPPAAARRPPPARPAHEPERARRRRLCAPPRGARALLARALGGLPRRPRRLRRGGRRALPRRRAPRPRLQPEPGLDLRRAPLHGACTGRRDGVAPAGAPRPAAPRRRARLRLPQLRRECRLPRAR